VYVVVAAVLGFKNTGRYIPVPPVTTFPTGILIALDEAAAEYNTQGPEIKLEADPPIGDDLICILLV
jgi:hypothetical protein